MRRKLNKNFGIFVIVPALFFCIILATIIIPDYHIEAASNKTVTVKSIKALQKAINRKKSKTVVLKVAGDEKLVIPESCSNKKINLVIDAPLAAVANRAAFKSIKINNIGTYAELRTDHSNTITVTDSDSVIQIVKDTVVKKLVLSGKKTKVYVEENTNIILLDCKKKSAEVQIVVSDNSVVKAVLNKKTNLTVTGDTSAKVEVSSKAASSFINSYVPLKLNASKKALLKLMEGSEGTVIDLAKKSVIVQLTNYSDYNPEIYVAGKKAGSDLIREKDDYDDIDNKGKEEYTEYKDDIELQKEIKSALKEMNISNKDSLYEKVRKVHDWMVYNFNYDILWWNIVFMQAHVFYNENQIKEVETHLPGEPKWVFENRFAICEGYAEIFDLFMKELGIECIVVVSEEIVPHAWNMVKMDDGHWYHIDVTYDDLNPTEEWSVGWYSTENLLRNDEGISHNHRNWPEDLPKADGIYYEENVNHNILYQRGENDEYWENGIIKYNYASDDRTYREYDEYGRMLLNMYIQDNGNKLYTYYDETGIKTEEKTLCVNGDIVDIFFDSSGIVIKQVMDNSDGTKSITEYNDSHKRISDIFYDSDGKIIQAWTMEYSEDGKEKLEVNLCADGSKFITTYDENGNQIQKTYTYADGRTIILDDSDGLDD